MSFTIVHRTPLDVTLNRRTGLLSVPFSEGLFKTTGTAAELISPVLNAPASFDRLVGSWNATITSSGTLILQAKILPAGGTVWSPWFELGREENKTFFSPGRQENSFGFVDQDTLTLKAPAKAFQYRLLLRQKASTPSYISLIAISVSDARTDKDKPFSVGPWVREIQVTPRSQMIEQPQYRRDICSPTSLAMALSHWDQNLTTARVAKKVQDQSSQAYGNWTFNTAFAGSAKLMSYFSYLSSFADLEREIAAGRPVVVSVTFGPGDLSGAPIQRTLGHLMLVVGFTRQGDVIALDPAAPNAKTARHVYRREQFRQVWLANKRGAAYLIGPLEGSTLWVGVSSTDLLVKPSTAPSSDSHDLNRLSQILYGESVTAQAVRGNWIRVTAEEEPHLSQNLWGGYPGWVRATDLSFAAPFAANRVVKVKTARAVSNGKTIFFSLGTRLNAIHETAGKTTIWLANSQTATIPSTTLKPPAASNNSGKRKRILSAARLFLGFNYVWGGRSGVQPNSSWGVDCSGLTGLAYRVAGLTIPRDAADQKRLAKPVAPKNLKPGDLIFLTNPNGSPRINHVMIYAGEDAFIESTNGYGGRLGEFRSRFGVLLQEIKPGQFVIDHSLKPPKSRRIYFGSFL